MVFCFVRDEDKVNRSGLAREWHGSAWPRPKSQIIEAVMFRSLRQRRGSKGFCQSAHFWPWRPWPPPGDPAILCTHITWDFSDAPSKALSERKHIACDQQREAQSMRMMKWTENSRLSWECLHSLAASVTLPQRHFCALFSPASVSNLPKTCWRLKPQVSLFSDD